MGPLAVKTLSKVALDVLGPASSSTREGGVASPFVGVNSFTGEGMGEVGSA